MAGRERQRGEMMGKDGGEGRTRMNSLHMARRDVLAFLAGAVVLGAMIAMNVYGI